MDRLCPQITQVSGFYCIQLSLVEEVGDDHGEFRDTDFEGVAIGAEHIVIASHLANWRFKITSTDIFVLFSGGQNGLLSDYAFTLNLPFLAKSICDDPLAA